MNKVVFGNTVIEAQEGIKARVKKLEMSTIFGQHDLITLREVFAGGPTWLLQMIEDAAPPVKKDAFGKPDDWGRRMAGFKFAPLAAAIRAELEKRELR
jgi:hypothetical protein